MFDKRGMGLSDPLPLDHVPTLERGVEDISVVLDEIESSQASLFATAERVR
ncbi:MAG: hypothetical protein QOJ79_1658 [Actinomycetota bacterium]|jgi:hypothetical protein|nr:hypothetical protein [Actinomycetota bacterium]